MKKAIFNGFAVAALALAVLFTGCKNESSNIETIRVDAVEITVKAMPGYNYVTWTMPEDYQGNELTVVRDDGKVLVTKGAYTTTAGTNDPAYNRYLDTDIQDGVTYKYTVYVDANGVNVTEAFKGGSVTTVEDVSTDYKALTKLGNSSSASCKAINPICIKDGKLMKALDLCDYEDGGNDDFVINEDNIVVEFNEFTGNYDIAFPTKAYLNYVTKLYKGNVIETFGLRKAGAENWDSAYNVNNTAINSKSETASKVFYTNDAAVRYDGPVTNAGEYTVVVEVSAVNQSYSTSVIKAKNKFTVKALDTATPTGTPKAGYIDDGKKIRLLWTPAVKADTTKWTEESYKVYVKDSFGVYTEIAPAKKAKVDEEGKEVVDDETDEVIMVTTLPIAKDLQANEDVYYIDYEVADNKVPYDFYVVLSDDGMFESTNKTAHVNRWAEISTYASLPNNSVSVGYYNIQNDELTNDAYLKISGVNQNTTKDNFVSVSAKYKILTKDAANGYLGDGTSGNNNTDYSELWFDKEFTACDPVTAADCGQFDFIVQNVAIDSRVIWLVKVTKKDCKDYYFYKDSGVSALNNITVGTTELSIVDVARTDTKTAQKVKFVITPSDTARKNYTYKLYYAKVDKIASTQGALPTYSTITDWTAVTENAAFAWDSTATTPAFKYTSAEITLDATTIAHEKNATDYATTGNKVAQDYADTYAIKLVKINKNTDENAPGNQYIYYTTKNVTKDAQ